MTHWREVFIKRNYHDKILNEHCYLFDCDRYEEFYQKIRVRRIFNYDYDDQTILHIMGYDKEINTANN